MAIPTEHLLRILNLLNPWWFGNGMGEDPPQFRRQAWNEVREWITEPPQKMAVHILGPRRVGKSVLVLQQIQQLLKDGVNPKKILYVSFDKPVLRLAGFDKVIRAWEESFSTTEGTEYLFLDEMQRVDNWGSEIKHMVDHMPNKRIVFTGSAILLSFRNKESGVGRWHDIRMGTMSFFEFLRLKNISPDIPALNGLTDLFAFNSLDLEKIRRSASACRDAFSEYLAIGGFPGLGQNDIKHAHKYIQDQVIDRSLSKDLANEYSALKYEQLRPMFDRLGASNGGILNMEHLRDYLGLKKTAASLHLEALQSSQLVEKLPGTVQGEGLCKARPKVYTTDHATALAVNLDGKDILRLPNLAGHTAECMVFNHILNLAKNDNTTFYYWKDEARRNEVDFVVRLDFKTTIPIEVKFRNHIDYRDDLKGLRRYYASNDFSRGYMVTSELSDFGPIDSLVSVGRQEGKLIKVPALLFCYWLGSFQDRGELARIL